jgi:hypothetical protein
MVIKNIGIAKKKQGYRERNKLNPKMLNMRNKKYRKHGTRHDYKRNKGYAN